MQSIDIVVRYQCGAYVTNAVTGKRSSSTSSPEAAANLQAIKLFADKVARVEQLSQSPGSSMVTTFRVYATTEEVCP